MVEAERPRRRSLHQPRQDRLAASTQAVAVGVERSTQVLDPCSKERHFGQGLDLSVSERGIKDACKVFS